MYINSTYNWVKQLEKLIQMCTTLMFGNIKYIYILDFSYNNNNNNNNNNN